MAQILSMAQRLTTPLLPDDYLSLINPLLDQRSLRARVTRIEHHGDRTCTLHLKTARQFPPFTAGQHVRIGVDVNAVRHWRTFSLSGASPNRPTRTLQITVKANGSGGVSDHLVDNTDPGDVVILGAPEGDFTLPEKPTRPILMIAGGSGITPFLSMIRTLTTDQPTTPVHLIYSAHAQQQMIAADELHQTSAAHDWLTLTLWESSTAGRIDFSHIGETVPDWRQRLAYVCGPAEMLTAADNAWRAAGLLEQLRIEQFQTQLAVVDGQGGTVTFAASSRTVKAGPSESLMDVGEANGVLLPTGCRAGICHTCVVPLRSGKVRDLRSGKIHGEPGEPIQTCINAAACDVEIDI